MGRIKSIGFSLIVGILLLSGTVYLTENWKALQPYMLLGSSLVMILIFLIYRRSFKINYKLFFVSSAFTVSCLISSLANQDLGLLEGALILYFLYFALGIFYPSIVKPENLNKHLAISYLSLHMPILFLPVLVTGINQIPYSGVFYNPNSLGAVTAITFIVLFSGLSSFLDDLIFKREIHIGKIIVLLSILIGTFTFALYSNSRTGFLTILAIVMIYVGILLSKLIFNMKIKITALIRILILIIILCVSGLVIVQITGIDELIKTTIIEKISRSSGDELSGRGEIWKRAFDDINLFGNGRDYFANTGEGAHSTYISIMGQYGAVPAALFIIFITMIAFYSYRYLKHNQKDRYKYLPFYSTMAFIIMSVTEGMLFKVVMLLTYCIIGVVSVRSKIKSG